MSGEHPQVYKKERQKRQKQKTKWGRENGIRGYGQRCVRAKKGGGDLRECVFVVSHLLVDVVVTIIFGMFFCTLETIFTNVDATITRHVHKIYDSQRDIE